LVTAFESTLLGKLLAEPMSPRKWWKS